MTEPSTEKFLYDKHEVAGILKRPVLSRMMCREETITLHLGQRRVRLTDELTVEDHLWPARAELTQLLQDANASTAMMSDKAKFILAFDLSKDGNVTLKVTKML